MPRPKKQRFESRGKSVDGRFCSDHVVEVCDSDYELDMDSSSDGDMPSLLPSRENSDDDSDDDMQNEMAQSVFDEGMRRPNSKSASGQDIRRSSGKLQRPNRSKQGQ